MINIVQHIDTFYYQLIRKKKLSNLNCLPKRHLWFLFCVSVSLARFSLSLFTLKYLREPSHMLESLVSSVRRWFSDWINSDFRTKSKHKWFFTVFHRFGGGSGWVLWLNQQWSVGNWNQTIGTENDYENSDIHCMFNLFNLF